jgi:hypothetical protein
MLPDVKTKDGDHGLVNQASHERVVCDFNTPSQIRGQAGRQ